MKILEGIGLRVFDSEFELSVRSGRVPGYRIFDMWGRNPDVDTGTEDIWANGGTRAFNTVAGTVGISSTSADDTSAGTGARTVRIYGLDASSNPQQEDMSLNGVTNVESTKSFLNLYAVEILTVGSAGASQGNITADIGGNDLAFIAAGEGHSRLTHRTIRAGWRAYILRMFASSTNAGSMIVELQTRNEAGAPWITIRELDVDNRHIVIAPPGGLAVVGPGTQIRMRATSTTNNESVSGGYTILLEKVEDEDPDTTDVNDI